MRVLINLTFSKLYLIFLLLGRSGIGVIINWPVVDVIKLSSLSLLPQEIKTGVFAIAHFFSLLCYLVERKKITIVEHLSVAPFRLLALMQIFDHTGIAF
jgi:hypothetical protein